MIQVAVGIGGNCGRLLLNRPGLACSAASRVAWRRKRISAASPKWTLCGVMQPMPLWLLASPGSTNRLATGLERMAGTAVGMVW